MSLKQSRFRLELKKYMKDNKYSSIQELLDKNESRLTCKYARETISRYQSEKKDYPIPDYAISDFSSLFNIRKEYLNATDSFRTVIDIQTHIKKQKNIDTAFHNILISLGYADLSMTDEEYNQTFPQNTKLFLESVKASLLEMDIALLCNINKDTMISITVDTYRSLISEVLDYLQYKIDKAFRLNSFKIPSCILEDGSVPLHPHTNIHLIDGTLLDFECKYTPTVHFDSDTINNTFNIKEI